MKIDNLTRPVMVLVFALSIFAFLNSCKRHNDFSIPINTGDVQASIFGQIIKEDGTPLKDAKVKIGANTFTTDDDGTFYFSNINTSQNATLIEVSKTNYFPGYRTLLITKNKDHYTRIMMMEMNSPYIFNAATGGSIPVNGGGSIVFPANALVYKNNGTPYTGSCIIHAKWIDPTSNNLHELIPGALRGIDTTNAEQILQTFGMMGVELYDNANQPLQLASNKTAQLSFPIPISLSSAAPVTIPLWYFDTATGMWKEEGNATKQGGNYVGQVKHFSFWNCDDPETFVNLELTLHDNNGSPLANIEIKITNTSTGAFTYGWTNSTGFVCGLVPDNANLKAEVIIQPCNMVVYSQTFTTITAPINLGTIVVSSATPYTVNVSGNVVDCSGASVSEGIVMISVGFTNQFVQTNSTGSFNTSFLVCGLPAAATLTTYDLTSKTSGNITTNLVSGTNNLGNLLACGSSPYQYVHWTSTVGSMTNTNSILETKSYFWVGSGINNTVVYAKDSITKRMIHFEFDGPRTVTGIHNLINYGDNIDNPNLAVGTIPVTITKYEPVGGYLEGSFSGLVSGSPIPLRTVTCSFRVKR